MLHCFHSSAGRTNNVEEPYQYRQYGTDAGPIDVSVIAEREQCWNGAFARFDDPFPSYVVLYAVPS